MSNSPINPARNVRIRQFRPEDAADACRLFAEGQRQFAAGIEQELESYISESLQDDLADVPLHYLSGPGSNFWVAEADGKLIGMAGLQGRSADVAQLRRLSVDIHWRRQGIGRKLLDRAQSFAIRHGYTRLCLSTITRLKPAIALYEDSGFRLSGEDKYGVITVLHFRKDLSRGANDLTVWQN